MKKDFYDEKKIYDNVPGYFLSSILDMFVMAQGGDIMNVCLRLGELAYDLRQDEKINERSS